MTCVARMDANFIRSTKERRKRKQRQSPRWALKASLRQAAAQKRLTVGFENSVNKLKKNPESVMVCIVLQCTSSSADRIKDEAGSNIKHTLLRAFCAESRINIVRVMANESLMHLVGQLADKVKAEVTNDSAPQNRVDCSLLVIEHPTGHPSSEDMIWASACEGGDLDIRTTNRCICD